MAFSSLRSIWGYKKGYSYVRQSTARVLEQYAKANEESDFIHTAAIHADDTFFCRTMAQDQALIVDHLHTRDADYEGYAIGGKNGLTLVAKI